MIRRPLIAAGLVLAGVLASELLTTGTAVANGPGGSTTTSTTAGGGCNGGGGCWNNLAKYMTTGGTSGYAGSPGSGNVVPAADVPPPACWMQPFNNGNDSGKAMYAWWKQYTQSGDPNVAAGIGTANYPQQFAAHKNAGQGQGSWYERYQNPLTPGNAGAQCVASLPQFVWVPAGQTPPLPTLPPQELAMYALSTLQLQPPKFDLSPTGRSYVTLPVFVTKLQNAPQQINLWATLGPERTDVQVTLNSITISPGTANAHAYDSCGPNGTRESQTQINKAGPGSTPDCGAVYSAPSSGFAQGYPLTVNVTYTATFHGPNGNQPIGPNPIAKQSAPHYVPVAEIQSINNNG